MHLVTYLPLHDIVSCSKGGFGLIKKRVIFNNITPEFKTEKKLMLPDDSVKSIDGQLMIPYNSRCALSLWRKNGPMHMFSISEYDVSDGCKGTSFRDRRWKRP